VESVARELDDYMQEFCLHCGPDDAVERLARWALRFRARGVREVLEKAADELASSIRIRYGYQVPEAYAQVCKEAAGLLRRLAESASGSLLI
jgi:hypothetical protein